MNLLYTHAHIFISFFGAILFHYGLPACTPSRFSHVWLIATPRTVARQAPLCPWRFSRQEYWGGLPCLPPEDLTNPGIKPRSPHCRWILYLLRHQGSPWILEWAACPFSRGSFWVSNQTRVSCISGKFLGNIIAMNCCSKKHNWESYFATTLVYKAEFIVI